MTRRSKASINKQKSLGRPAVQKTVDSTGKQARPVGHQSVTRAGMSHFIHILPLEGVKGISIKDIAMSFREKIAGLPKWKPPTGFPSDMDYTEYRGSLNAVYNWLVANAPSAIPDTIAGEVLDRMVADTKLQLRPVVITALCSTASTMIEKARKAVDPATERMHMHIERWFDVVLDDHFVYTHPITGETRRFGTHQWPLPKPKPVDVVANDVVELEVPSG